LKKIQVENGQTPTSPPGVFCSKRHKRGVTSEGILKQKKKYSGDALRGMWKQGRKIGPRRGKFKKVRKGEESWHKKRKRKKKIGPK